MDYQQKLQRLEQRFLRADSNSLINAACVEGGILLVKMITDGLILSNEAFEQLVIAAKGLDPALAEFAQVALFKQFAFFESSDRNVLALKTLSSEGGVAIRSPKDGSEREQSERLAAFCVELTELVNPSDPWLVVERSDLTISRMTKWIDRIKQTIIELEGLTMCAEDLMHRTKKQFAEFELNGFDYLMASAVIDVDDACEELKKMVAEMEASND